MLENFKSHIEQNLYFLSDKKLLIANSSGLDSIVLTNLCVNAGLTVSLAHCNFNLRGKESDGDEEFIMDLGEELDLEVFVQHFDTKAYAKENKLSTQEAARNLRYQWFADLAKALNFDFILTAHHLDDNLETFLINFSRGTGLDGLTGIPEINGNIVRPLLPFSREQIEVYAIENNFKWREDSSNATTDYLRNKVRHDIIPTLKNITPQLLANFQNTTSHLKEIRDIVDDRIDEISDLIIEEIDEYSLHFNSEEILKLNNPKAYLYQILKEYKFTEWNDVYDLLEAQSGKIIYSEKYRLLKDRKYIILSEKKSSDNVQDFVISEDLNEVNFGNATLIFSIADSINEPSQNSLHADFDTLNFPLKLRRWQEGDYFYPLGLGGKKKLSKFFKDEKFSKIEKEESWLMTSQGNIVWVLGHRMDERFKVTSKTKQILKADFLLNNLKSED
ncbi:tRNA(Ile)-lysidine synthase [Flavobacteriaceae bacterium MAR_2010_188]|nr:tRNA(Ile)-lysidine synthase [Flavobacteriaceae bacterium MAR_2010_188]